MASDTLLARLLVDGERGSPPRLDVDFAIPAGLSVLMGPSGAGKSTLLLALTGLVRPRVARVVLGDDVVVDTARGRDTPTHRRRMGLVFQSHALFPHLSVWQNVAFGLQGDNARERAHAWLQRMRVGSLAARRPATLSGGEAQRVALARALAVQPRLLLLDEPFSALDESLRRELGAEVKGLIEEAGIPAVLVTHDAGDAALGDRILRLHAGCLRDAPTTTASLRG